jgi:hypothetical protein
MGCWWCDNDEKPMPISDMPRTGILSGCVNHLSRAKRIAQPNGKVIWTVKPDETPDEIGDPSPDNPRPKRKAIDAGSI